MQLDENHRKNQTYRTKSFVSITLSIDNQAADAEFIQ